MIKVGSLVEYHGIEYPECRGTIGLVRSLDANEYKEPTAIVDFFSLCVIPENHPVKLDYLQEIEVKE